MTLSPVFRSEEAIESLRRQGYLELLAASVDDLRRHKAALENLLGELIDERYIDHDRDSVDDVKFLQDHFFLILFDTAYKQLGCTARRQMLYGMINLSVKGVITAADNVFDGENKTTLPLKLGSGSQYRNIMELLCCDRLIGTIVERYEAELDPLTIRSMKKTLLSSMASIGRLEGSEEDGIGSILPVEAMIEKVHRLRGGQLFGLAFIPPQFFEPEGKSKRWRAVRRGFEHLGTAFQIVDDIVDFEFDLSRRSHNLLTARITQHGSPRERAALHRISQQDLPEPADIHSMFGESVRAVVDLATAEACKGFTSLLPIGFCFRPDDAEFFVRAIGGQQGNKRLAAIATG